MFLSPAQALELVRCPVTGSPLNQVDGVFRSLPPNERTYPVLNGIPVLVDFDDSVLDQSEIGGSLVERPARRGLAKWVKALVSKTPMITESNLQLFVAELKKNQPRPTILIVGGGTIGHGTRSLYDDQSVDVISFDIYASPTVHFIADAHKIPLAPSSVDGVVIQAVLEHVLEPHRVVSELHRILRPNGLIYAETPFLQPVHEGPYDFTRFTESGHRYLFKNFELIKSGSVGGPGPMLLSAVEIVSRSMFRSRHLGKVVKTGLFWLKYLDNCFSEPYRIDAASGVFFLGRRAERPIRAKDAIAHYRGSQRAY